MNKVLTATILTFALGVGLGTSLAQETTPIVFVPQKMLTESRKSGKIKDKTFYWSNQTNNEKAGPSVQSEGGASFLLLKGPGDQTTNKSETILTVVRAFNVPGNAKSVTLSAEVKATYDEWIDNAPKTEKNLPSLTYSFVKDGQETRGGTPLPLPPLNLNQWKKTAITTSIPAGAQQLVVTAEVNFPTSISLASLTATFSENAVKD